MNSGPQLRRTFAPWCVRAGALLALGLLPLCLAAQDTDDEDDGPPISTALLSLRFDARGNQSVRLHADKEIPNWSILASALADALHCPAGVLKPPPARPPRNFANLSARQQADRQKWADLERRRSLQGECPQSMTHQGFVLSTDLRLAPLWTELQKAGEQQMWVNITFPKSRFANYTPTETPLYERSQFSTLYYLIGARPGAPQQVHLEFGLGRNDAIRSAALPIAFLLLPILVVLWAQRAAVRDARVDPTSAWFSYFRVLTWCANCLLIIWMIGQSVRQGLEALFDYQLAAGGAGAVALRVAIFMLPPWIAYLICVLSSYRVYFHVRGETWTRGEFFANQLLDVATQMLPLMCFLAGMGMMQVSMRASMVLFISVYIVYVVCVRLKVKVSGMHIEALSTGELRDRVFELAKKAAVEIRQVFIMPAGKSQMANAFASRNRMVIFTDFLLNRLNKREVSAIAAHEITHIEKRHGTWKIAGLAGLVLFTSLSRGVLVWANTAIERQIRMHPLNGLSTPAAGMSSNLAPIHAVIGRLLAFPELDLILYIVGFLLYLWQSRMMERSADTGALRLTQDPEAVITGLLKLGRINLLPNQWGALTGPLLTHPSTLKRVERVARIGQVSPARLQQLLMESQSTPVDAGEAEDVQPEERFSEANAVRNRVVTTARAAQLIRVQGWVLWSLHIVPALLVAWCAALLREAGHDAAANAVYLAGAVACIGIYGLAGHWLGTLGRAKLERDFRARLESEGIAVQNRFSLMAALSPHAELRYYAMGFAWDTGCLIFARDRLCFVGDEIRFALRREQVKTVRLGPGQPGWYAVPRVYVEWWDKTAGTLRTWGFQSVMPCRFWQFRRRLREMYAECERWHKDTVEFPEAASPMSEWTTPALGEVTSHPASYVFGAGRFVKNCFWVMMLGCAAATALGISSQWWYVCCIVLVIRLYECVPYWLTRETRPLRQEAPAGSAA